MKKFRVGKKGKKIVKCYKRKGPRSGYVCNLVARERKKQKKEGTTATSS